MSTILKSLKRLEKEKGSIATDENPTFHTRHTMNRAVREAWFKNRLFQWGLLGVALVAGALFLVATSRKAPEQHPTTPHAGQSRAISLPQPSAVQTTDAFPRTEPPAARQPLRPLGPPLSAGEPRPSAAAHAMRPSDVLALKPSPSAVGRVPATVAPDYAAGERPPAGPASSAQTVEGPDALDSAPRAVDTAPAVHPVESTATHSEAQAAAARSEESTSAAPARKQAESPGPINTPFANADPLTDGRLKVQAIVYAPDPSDRMAVVNNRVVREGAVLEGLPIVGIGEDAVYVREAGRVLKVEFGKP